MEHGLLGEVVQNRGARYESTTIKKKLIDPQCLQNSSRRSPRRNKTLIPVALYLPALAFGDLKSMAGLRISGRDEGLAMQVACMNLGNLFTVKAVLLHLGIMYQGMLHSRADQIQLLQERRLSLLRILRLVSGNVFSPSCFLSWLFNILHCFVVTLTTPCPAF